jgi:hypothetical protein
MSRLIWRTPLVSGISAIGLFVGNGEKVFLRRSEGRDWHLADIPTAPAFVRFWRWSQRIDATLYL